MTQIYLTMPQPGETITEGSVGAWMLPVGSHVKEGQAVVELETEKALFEYESPFEGKIIKILADSNTKVSVGAPLAILEVAADKARVYSNLGLAQKVDEEILESKVTIATSSKQEILFSPYIRRLLQENNLTLQDIAALKGSGPNGRPTKEDVEAYLSTLPNPPLQREGTKNPPLLCKEGLVEVGTCKGYEDIDVSPIRARIAEHMQQSKQTIPHAHTGVDVDLTPLLALRSCLKNDFMKSKEFPLRLMPLLFTAVKKACEFVPLVISSILQKENIIRVHKNINLGMAMGLKNGLLTPVIKGCEVMSFLEFAKAYEDILNRSEENKLKPTDFEGANFTFNNFGAFGLDSGSQIIPPGQACVLGMGAIHQKPWVIDNQIVIRSIATFFLAFDHRIMDGREAGLFLTELKKQLELLNMTSLI